MAAHIILFFFSKIIELQDVGFKCYILTNIIR